MSAPYLPRTVICSRCANPLPIGKPEPAWHERCRRIEWRYLSTDDATHDGSFGEAARFANRTGYDIGDNL